ncbi:MAG: transposase [Burkholderia sp.]
MDRHHSKPWIVHFAKPSDSHVRNVNYLGRYIKRPRLSQSRLMHYDGKTVTVDYLNHRGGQHRIAECETQAFIGRFVEHIPDKHFRMINVYDAGITRGKSLA